MILRKPRMHAPLPRRRIRREWAGPAARGAAPAHGAAARTAGRGGHGWLAALLAVALAAAAGMQARPAYARKQSQLDYSYSQVWNAALRLVRVDLRLPITDRDPDAGYLLFDYLDHGKRYPGSIEVIRSGGSPKPPVTAVVQVQGMPSYVEAMVLDKLAKKLRAEYGEPIKRPDPPAKPPEKPPEDADGGASATERH